MLRFFPVHLVRLKTALDLATELMARAGYPPNTRKRGIVRWQEQKDPNHNCEICFTSYRGFYRSGYIGVTTCDCDKRSTFRDIINIFERELAQREWIETPQRQLFNIAGSRSS